MSFRDFMEMALYHPLLGYYMSGRQKIGWGGDFFTSPDVHKVFGISIMKQLAEMRLLLGTENTFHVIEAGGGKGNLCIQLLSAAREREPDLFESIRYTIVEKSPGLIERQRKSLMEEGLLGRVAWREDMESALKISDAAVLFSNELIDALPVHRVRFDGAKWEEIYIETDGEGFTEATGQFSTPARDEYLSKLAGPYEAGYTTEVNLDGIAWIKTAGQNLKKGFVITIDYGYPQADYYSPLRSDGTLLCYYRHTTSENPYERVGEQDISANALSLTRLIQQTITLGLFKRCADRFLRDGSKFGHWVLLTY